MYRAPVSEIAFTLKHVAGLGEALATGAFPGLSEDVVDAVLAEAGRFAAEELAPLNRVGDLQGVAARGRRRRHAARLAGGLSRLGGGRLERHRRAGGDRRAGAAADRSPPPRRRCGTAPAWPSRSARC